MASQPTSLFQTEPQSPSFARRQVAKGAEIGCFLQSHHSSTVAQELIKTAKTLVGPRGRGIYATDESPWTIHETLGIVDKPENEKKQMRESWRKAAYENVSNGELNIGNLHAPALTPFES